MLFLSLLSFYDALYDSRFFVTPGIINIEAASLNPSVPEDAGSVTITLGRSDDLSGVGTIDCGTAAGKLS